ncbi:DUF4190 domain-containing protein [Alteribacter natronophilus]|uniref:DUF4190 domain-containing protein n=1 Tax=Alteribacter natronophilus TaxID=2583810 RepID=UPI00110EB0BF|nr:DUF4190 domain-containing protein [Alteribacter natronophilus]TMW72870.1 DUF4190 domain-containing protein [Alteribacter natronophilus]
MTDNRPEKTNPKASTGMIFGILSILLFLLPFVSIVLAIAAIALGFLALREIRATKEKGSAFALTAMITGAVGLVIPAVLGFLAYYMFTNGTLGIIV